MAAKDRPRDQVVDEIRSRWRAVEFVAAWAALPAARRERVFGEFEESARTLADSEPVLAADISVALDALQSVSAAAAVLGTHAASADIATLIGLIGDSKSE